MPAWVHNLRAAGTATVRVRGREARVRPIELAGPERAAAWARVLTTRPNYAHYEARTERRIPVYRLAPDTLE